MQTVHESFETNIETHGEIAVMDHTGDTKVIFSRDNEDEVAAARKQFADLKKKGFAAFRVKGKNGEKADQVDDFDPREERYSFVPPMQGG
jgi:hypothetical protein